MSKQLRFGRDTARDKRHAKSAIKQISRAKAKAVCQHKPSYLAYKLQLTTGCLFSVFRAQEAAVDYE